MKHARFDYNRIQDPENKIPEDEPVFLLRAQDELAPGLLMAWAEAIIARGGDRRMAAMTMKHAAQMIQWQIDHGSKIPDLPPPNEVYSKPECIYAYCPHPDICKENGCQHIQGNRGERIVRDL